MHDSVHARGHAWHVTCRGGEIHPTPAAAAILVLVGRYGLSTSWPDLFRPSPQHGAAMDGRNKSDHDHVATRWAKMRIAAAAGGIAFGTQLARLRCYLSRTAGLGREERTNACPRHLTRGSTHAAWRVRVRRQHRQRRAAPRPLIHLTRGCAGLGREVPASGGTVLRRVAGVVTCPASGAVGQLHHGAAGRVACSVQVVLSRTALEALRTARQSPTPAALRGVLAHSLPVSPSNFHRTVGRFIGSLSPFSFFTTAGGRFANAGSHFANAGTRTVVAGTHSVMAGTQSVVAGELFVMAGRPGPTRACHR
jgi:hypothetical protein